VRLLWKNLRLFVEVFREISAFSVMLAFFKDFEALQRHFQRSGGFFKEILGFFKEYEAFSKNTRLFQSIFREIKTFFEKCDAFARF
jgi:hypothetical protein